MNNNSGMTQDGADLEKATSGGNDVTHNGSSAADFDTFPITEADTKRSSGDARPQQQQSKMYYYMAATILVFKLVVVAVVLIVIFTTTSGGDDDKDGAITPTTTTANEKSIFPYDIVDPPTSSLNGIHEDWKPSGGGRYAEYTDGSLPYVITDEIRNQSDMVALKRRDHVKAAMEHAWKGYREHAWGYDNLQPISGIGSDDWGGVAMTLVDSLDTLWMMNMMDEFWQARDYVAYNLTFDKDVSVIAFELNIRVLGGLLTAYDLSGDYIFMEKALDLAVRLYQSFDFANNPTGIPYDFVNLQTGKAKNDYDFAFAFTSRAGTLQLEYRALDVFAGGTNETTEMRQQIEAIYDILHALEPDDWLYPTLIQNMLTDKAFFFTDHVSFSIGADSLYEYFLKCWLQGGKNETKYRQYYDESIQGLHDVLLLQSTPSGLYYVADKRQGEIDHRMDHLTCFSSAMLALGAYTDPLGLESDRAQRDLTTAKALAYTCYQMNARTATGLSPENYEVVEGQDFMLRGSSSFYLLRPEVVESFYVLHQLTGDPIYREWGWEIFQAIEAHCRTEIGYGAVNNVSNPLEEPRDSMESFFLAETLKYLYLLFDVNNENSIDILNTHVFNTEAHPLPVFTTAQNTTVDRRGRLP